jgi:hypothetical protein
MGFFSTWFLSCALAIHNGLLLKQWNLERWSIAFALINALVNTRVITIGGVHIAGQTACGQGIIGFATWIFVLACSCSPPWS